MSQGQISIMRASWGRAFYFLEDKLFLNCADAILVYADNDDMRTLVRHMRIWINQKTYLERQRNISEQGIIYLGCNEKMKLENVIFEINQNIEERKGELMNFILVEMEKRGVLQEKFSMLALKKLPLIFKEGHKIYEDREEFQEDAEKEEKKELKLDMKV